MAGASRAADEGGQEVCKRPTRQQISRYNRERYVGGFDAVSTWLRLLVYGLSATMFAVLCASAAFLQAVLNGTRGMDGSYETLLGGWLFYGVCGMFGAIATVLFCEACLQVARRTGDPPWRRPLIIWTIVVGLLVVIVLPLSAGDGPSGVLLGVPFSWVHIAELHVRWFSLLSLLLNIPLAVVFGCLVGMVASAVAMWGKAPSGSVDCEDKT